MTDAIIMVRLAACGPRPLGQTVMGMNLDDFPLKPGKALWIRQVTDHDTGNVKRYSSDQQGAVSHNDVDWGDPL